MSNTLRMNPFVKTTVLFELIVWGLQTITTVSKFVLVLWVCNFPDHNPFSIYVKFLIFDIEYIQSLCIIIAFLRKCCFSSRMVCKLSAACFAEHLRNDFMTLPLMLHIFICFTLILCVCLLFFDLINLCSTSGSQMEVDFIGFF